MDINNPRQIKLFDTENMGSFLDGICEMWSHQRTIYRHEIYFARHACDLFMKHNISLALLVAVGTFPEGGKLSSPLYTGHGFARISASIYLQSLRIKLSKCREVN